mmetsp:Transcript_5759/g.8855  ORF Transcript_5759/g.8855 Transcript_5759/m.8855 type:complete len:94 (+) Transcript_5759:148-429(+)
MYVHYAQKREKSSRSIKLSSTLFYPKKGVVVSTGELQNDSSSEDMLKSNPFSGMLMGISFNESSMAALSSHELWENLCGWLFDEAELLLQYAG